MSKPIGYVVFYHLPDDGMQWPYTADPDCEGALQACVADDLPVMFPTRAEARRAIRISTAWARLNESKGAITNDDFTNGIKHIRIVPLRAPVPLSK